MFHCDFGSHFQDDEHLFMYLLIIYRFGYMESDLEAKLMEKLIWLETRGVGWGNQEFGFLKNLPGA